MLLFASCWLATLSGGAETGRSTRSSTCRWKPPRMSRSLTSATFKQIKTLRVGSHPHGQASPQSQDKLYVASEVGGIVTLIDTIKDEVIKTFDVGFGTEPQNGAITPDGRFLYQPSYAGYWQVFDTQKEEIIEYIHTLGIGHNTVMDPNGRFVYLLPIAGGRRALEAAVTRTCRGRSRRK